MPQPYKVWVLIVPLHGKWLTYIVTLFPPVLGLLLFSRKIDDFYRPSGRNSSLLIPLIQLVPDLGGLFIVLVVEGLFQHGAQLVGVHIFQPVFVLFT